MEEKSNSVSFSETSSSVAPHRQSHGTPHRQYQETLPSGFLKLSSLEFEEKNSTTSVKPADDKRESDVLGTGGFGVVRCAKLDGKQVAVKFLKFNNNKMDRKVIYLPIKYLLYTFN